MSTISTISLGDLLTLERRPVFVAPDRKYAEIGTYSFGRGIFHKPPRTGLEVGDKKLFVIREGDFILQITFAWEGAVALASAAEDGLYGSVRFLTFRVDEKHCYPRYLLYYFRTLPGREQLVRISPGSAGRNRVLSVKRIPEVLVPLPPINEQRRIVARIEELSAKIEEARGLRREGVGELEAFEQSSAARMLSNQKLAELTTVGDTCDVRGGIQKSGARTPGVNPRRYITVAHVQRNWIDTGDPRYFEVSDAELEKWRLLPGDVLVIEGNGSPDQIGRTALFTGEIKDCVHQNHVIRVRPNKAIFLPDYLNTYLNSSIGRGQMLERSRTTSGLYNLSVGRIKNLEVPVPSLGEQHRIVAYIDNLRAKVDPLKRLHDETEKELNALLPSILSRAFAGEL